MLLTTTILPISIPPLAERVPSAFVVFEERPPTEVLTRRWEWELDTTRAQLGIGALDVGAIKEQVGMREAIRNRTPGFLGPSWAEDEQQVLIGRSDFDPPFVPVLVVARYIEAHAGGPKVEGSLLVCHWNDDLANSCDHDVPFLDRIGMLMSDISIVVISTTDCILPM
jgi:hypothetical protein